MANPRMLPRVTQRPGLTEVEMGASYTNGYKVEVGWSEQDQQWVAYCTGMKAFVGGEVFALGHSREGAVLELCCALAATVDCFGQIVDDQEKEA